MGYDILVWLDEEMDVVCCGYTEAGETFLRTIYPPYTNGDILEIISHPEEFKASIPFNINVGLRNYRTNKVAPMDGPRLQ